MDRRLTCQCPPLHFRHLLILSSKMQKVRLKVVSFGRFLSSIFTLLASFSDVEEIIERICEAVKVIAINFHRSKAHLVQVNQMHNISNLIPTIARDAKRARNPPFSIVHLHTINL